MKVLDILIINGNSLGYFNKDEVDLMKNEIYDLTIIGGGPVGIYGAFYAGMHGMRTKIIDALPELGGNLQHSIQKNISMTYQGTQKLKRGKWLNN